MAGRRSDMLRIARGQLGFIEGPNNKTPYAKPVGHADNQPWCASFVAWCAMQAGVKLPSTSAYTPAMANGFKNATKYGRKPVAGAIFFLYFPRKGRIAHTGIVESVARDGSFVTIEGNTDVAGGRTGGRVMRHRRTTANMTFGYPVYAPEPVAPKPKPKPKATTPPFKRGLKVGDAQNHQAWLWQNQMYKRGWKIEADGFYGEKSADVAEAFAKEKKIRVMRDRAGNVVVNEALWNAAWTAKVTG